MIVVVPEAPESTELTARLQQEGQEVWYAGALPPGTDRDHSLREAFERCVLIAVVLVKATEDLYSRGLVAAAVELRRADPSRVALVPVRVSGDVQVYGLNILQEAAWDEQTASRLADVARQRQVVDPDARVRLLLVTHPDEGAADLARLLKKLELKRRLHKPIERCWLDADLDARVRAADRVLVLLGGKVDEAALGRLPGLVAGGGVRVFPRKPDDDLLTDSELDLQSQRRRLLRDLQVGAQLEGEALVQAVNDDVDAWLQARFVGDPNTSLRPWERTWLEQSLREWRAGRHGGLIKQTTGQSVPREALYVPGVAQAGPWARDKDGVLRWQRRGETPEATGRPDGEPEQPAWIDELLAFPALRALVIEGEAGTGKTVLLQHIATVLAARHLEQEVAEAHRVDLRALAAGLPLLPIPVWLEARVLADRVREGTAHSVVRLVAELLAPCGPIHTDEVEQGLQQGRYLLLVDARDEVTADGLAALDRALAHIARASPHTRLVITTRPAAHTGAALGAPFTTVHLALLDEPRRADMVRRWCAAQPSTWPERDVELHDAVRQLGGHLRGDASDPLSNPLFLTCAMIRFEVDHRLPDDRADLIDRLVDMLCMSRGTADREGDSDRRRREAARAVAWALQRSGGTAIGVDEAARAVQAALTLEKERDGQDALDRLALHTMLFRFETQDGRRVVRPWHRTFQELLAGEAEIARGEGVQAVYRRWSEAGWLDDPRWQGCVRLMPGVLATRSREEAHLTTGSGLDLIS